MPQMTGFLFGELMAIGHIFYERALEDKAAASIAVEKINGPAMVISGTDDQLWPSTRLSEMVVCTAVGPEIEQDDLLTESRRSKPRRC